MCKNVIGLVKLVLPLGRGEYDSQVHNPDLTGDRHWCTE